MTGQPIILAQAAVPGKSYTPVQRHAVKEWALLSGGVILVGMLLVALVVMLVRRHAVGAIAPARGKRRARARPDPWTEAARRLEPPPDGSRDDTVDIDPNDLGPQDVDEGPGDEPPPPPDPHGGTGWRGGRR